MLLSNTSKKVFDGNVFHEELSYVGQEMKYHLQPGADGVLEIALPGTSPHVGYRLIADELWNDDAGRARQGNHIFMHKLTLFLAIHPEPGVRWDGRVRVCFALMPYKPAVGGGGVYDATPDIFVCHEPGSSLQPTTYDAVVRRIFKKYFVLDQQLDVLQDTTLSPVLHEQWTTDTRIGPDSHVYVTNMLAALPAVTDLANPGAAVKISVPAHEVKPVGPMSLNYQAGVGLLHGHSTHTRYFRFEMHFKPPVEMVFPEVIDGDSRPHMCFWICSGGGVQDPVSLNVSAPGRWTLFLQRDYTENL